MNLADRLRGVVRPAGGPEGPPLRPVSAAETLGGEWHGDDHHRYLVVDRKYAPGHRLGRVAVADCLPSDDGLWPRVSLLEPSVVPGRMMFVDLETTGLGGGAGTCAFLVGCGWFEGAAFRIRQFFLADYAAERAMLDAVAEAARAAGGLVTYNGKSFDLPLIETRFLFHRMQTPFAGMPHIDMLHPARRLWRPEGDESACRLTTMEEALFGHVREDDVPGFEIPSRYFHYVRTSDARPLDAVLEHNRLDLIALAMLTARAAQLLDEGPAAARSAREALGLGRLYERGGLMAEARASFVHAAAMETADVATRAEALLACAVLSRRDRHYDEAAAAWRRVLDLRPCPARMAREATVALAVYHEHRERDLQAARRFALQALQFNISLPKTQAAQHRLARLNRKIGGPPAESAALF